jgi:Family of unknown function (DUF6084)
MVLPTTPRGAGGAETAPQLEFSVEGAEPVRYAAVPSLGFKLALERVDGGAVRSVALNAQIRIAATRRSYSREEQERLFEIFGPIEMWSRSVRSLLWLNATAHVPAFEGRTVYELELPCSYDFELTSARYFDALEDGEIPLEFLFGGSVFYAGPNGGLQVASIAWDREAEFRLPVTVWRDMMDQFFPGAAWLRLGKESFDRLYAYKSSRALASWEEAVDSLLVEAGEA